MAVFIGTFMDIYSVFRHWDTVLHGLSACLFGLLSMCLVCVWFKNRDDISPLFLLIFAFCFSIAIEAVWEIYEYTVDLTSYDGLNEFIQHNLANLVNTAFANMSYIFASITSSFGGAPFITPPIPTPNTRIIRKI